MNNTLLRDKVRRVALVAAAEAGVTLTPRVRREFVTEVVDKLIEEKGEFAIYNMFRAHRIALIKVLDRL